MALGEEVVEGEEVFVGFEAGDAAGGAVEDVVAKALGGVAGFSWHGVEGNGEG